MAISEQVFESPSFTKRVTTIDPLQTTNETTTTAWTISVPTNKAFYIKVDYIANNTAYTSAIGGLVQAVFMRASGNVTRTASSDSSGLLSTLLSSFVAVQPKVNIVANNTGGNFINITVTGVAATTLNWHLEITSYMNND